VTQKPFFGAAPQSARLHAAVTRAVARAGPARQRVSKSQVAFVRRRAFAWTWMPRQYLRAGAPLVLTVALRRRDRSPRWKQVVEAAPGRFTHHLELRRLRDIDAAVVRWLAEAWADAGPATGATAS
jgi:Domain of unknown function (DUF5655)